MLLEFKIKNFKSFADETIFSMIAAPKQSGLDYSINKINNGKKTTKVLCSSVIYGPNAAGKTNIIGAMDVFKRIVSRGNIKNAVNDSVPNPAAFALELIPNNKLSTPQPVEFLVDFIVDGLRIQYGIRIDLGLFLDQSYERKVLSEELFVNGTRVFCRNDLLSIGNLEVINDYLSTSFLNNTKKTVEISKSSLDKEELFLTNGFRLIISQSFVNLINRWLTEKFIVICNANSMQFNKQVPNPQKETVYIEKKIDKAAKLFGINSNGVGYIVSDDESNPKLCSIFGNLEGKTNTVIVAEAFESYGTIRFMNIFPLVVRAIQTGATLVVDEFDASIHPMALMNIINLFHNDEINTKGAQLIFNTHNPIFLNSNLFRRDEIKFVERDDESHFSKIYSLSDFGTSGEKGVRKHEDYMKNYFISQYGAIKDIDFSPIFDGSIENKDEG